MEYTSGSIGLSTLKEMDTRKVCNYKLQKWVPYVSDPDKWYMYQYFLDLREGNVQHHNQGHYNVGSGVIHGQLKEYVALHKELEKQRPVVNLVSPVT